jgi:mono/diheme cytochrome c family protein
VVDALRTGRSRDRVLNLWDMPWQFLHRLQPDDARAVARYLKSLPPVHNPIPGPLHYGVVETIVMKLGRGLPAANPGRLTFADGVFGQVRPGLPRDLPQRVLIAAQWVVLVAGVVAFVRTRPAESVGATVPRGRWRSAARVVLGVLILVGALLGWAIYALPAVRVIPPEQLSAGAVRTIPEVDPAAIRTPEETALAERGRYLFTVTSCALCHLNNGAGGPKIRWRPMGTLWTRNITSDPDTGIGRWSDEEIARAIRSGISRDGRVLHWQGMIWDHLSNLDGGRPRLDCVSAHTPSGEAADPRAAAPGRRRLRCLHVLDVQE